MGRHLGEHSSNPPLKHAADGAAELLVYAQALPLAGVPAARIRATQIVLQLPNIRENS
jgi:hypothetical protein